MRSTAEMLERNLKQLLRQLRVGDSLLFLNKVLAVAQGELDDPPTQQAIHRWCPKGVPAFVIHLITRYLLKYGRMNTPTELDWARFPQVLDSAFQLAIADPISDSSDDAVRGYFVRMMSQQMQRHKPMQCYGLAIALFQDVDAITGPKPYDLRADVEATIKMPAEVFMQIGQAAHAATCATSCHNRLRGTLDLGWLKKAAEDLPAVPWLEKWPDFAAAVAITPQGFGELVDATAKAEGLFPAYAFNPLRRKPVILVDAARYIAVDPWLLAERTSLGIFYDLFELHAGNARAVRDFTSNFGQPFELLVGDLLEASLPLGTVWKESVSDLAKAKKGAPACHKLGDFAYQSASHPVMIECAALRPTVNLYAQATTAHCEDAAKKISKELLQGFEHVDRIQEGGWEREGLTAGPWVTLVVTFGRFETVNWIFFRKLIDELLAEQSCRRYPYLVLSIEELDSLVRQAELGQDFGESVATLASEPTLDALGSYQSSRWQDHVSSYSLSRAERMYGFLPQQEDTAVSGASEGQKAGP